MNLAPGGVPLSFEVTFDSGVLNVAMSVYDTTAGSAVLVSGPAAMTNLAGTNSYYGKFTAADGHSYVIFKAVYTDGTFATLDSNYAAGTESIIAEDIGDGGGGGTTADVIGYVIPNPTVIGYVKC